MVHRTHSRTPISKVHNEIHDCQNGDGKEMILWLWLRSRLGIGAVGPLNIGDRLVRRKFDYRLFNVDRVDRHMNTFAEGKVG